MCNDYYEDGLKISISEDFKTMKIEEDNVNGVYFEDISEFSKLLEYIIKQEDSTITLKDIGDYIIEHNLETDGYFLPFVNDALKHFMEWELFQNYELCKIEYSSNNATSEPETKCGCNE